MQSFTEWRERFEREGFLPVRRQWLAGAEGLGARVEVHLAQERFTGRALDLDREGFLLVRQDGDEGKVRRVLAGDVALLP